MTADYGDPRLPERFWLKVHPEPNTGCWLWSGAQTTAGYGNWYSGGATRLTHRVTYSALSGPIPSGLQIDHLCRAPGCCNPAHLEPVTVRENSLRSPFKGGKTHCNAGHPFTEENTVWHPRGSNPYLSRLCRTCANESRRRSYARTRARAAAIASATCHAKPSDRAPGRP